MNIDEWRAKHYNAYLSTIQRHSARLAVIRVQPDEPMQPFRAGQWTLLGLGVWEPRHTEYPDESWPAAEPQKVLRRPYSISSPIWSVGGEQLLDPNDEDAYEFLVSEAPAQASGGTGAALAARLLALESGARLWVGKPQGNYTLETVRPQDHVVFLATGTGEAPHNRMICELLRGGHLGRVVSVVTVHRSDDLVYRPQHERLAARFANYTYCPVVTQDSGDLQAAIFGSRLQSMMRDGSLESRISLELDPQQCHVFLCGHPQMLGRPKRTGRELMFPSDSGMIELLHARGFPIDPPDARVHFERF